MIQIPNLPLPTDGVQRPLPVPEAAEEDPLLAAIRARRPAFLANRRADVMKMREALAAGNFGMTQSIAHNCKGTGTGYGFPEISSLGLAIEKAAKAGDAKEALESIDFLEVCVLKASEETKSI